MTDKKIPDVGKIEKDIEQVYIADVKKVKKCMTQCANSFFAIGEVLSRMKEDGSYKVGEYKNFIDFCKCEFGISKNSAYNFIAIYKKFSDGKYKRFSYSQLTEMLSLPKSVIEEIKEDTTIQEIRAIKKDLKEDKKEDKKENILKFGQGGAVDSVVEEKANNDGVVRNATKKEVQEELMKYIDDNVNLRTELNNVKSEYKELENNYNSAIADNLDLKKENITLKEEIKKLKAELKNKK